MDALPDASGAFAVRLLKTLCRDRPGDNVCVSPVSVAASLAMLLLGAEGSTKAQMAKMLSVRAEQDVHRGFQSLLAKVNRPDSRYSLRMANRLFGEKSCNFHAAFTEACRRLYQADLGQLSFASAPEQATAHINNWVSKKTEGKIQELLPRDSVSEQTKLVLVNAVYFKGRWEDPFDKTYTTEMPFKVNQEEQRPAQMMFQESTFKLNYVEEIQTQILELPYVQKELRMVILLPDDDVDLAWVEEKLTFENFQAWTRPGRMQSTEVEVLLPRFRLAADYGLEAVLPRLGMVDAFEARLADFSALAEPGNLCLSAFVHKTWLEVTEEGTEAAAASGVDIEEDCGVEMPHFCADHPFLFFIVHRDTHSILFCGRFCSP
ncbi:serpin B9-like [Sorex araneus]|uniref:serpin B9-like n=1 Tax=Sorex araneus TaxID=42254 RepID=UPI002433B292|nr:serpin B9-like [Sorex araneus]XP_054982930.1 serpin B9-like [Sorex araneus]